MMNGVLKRKYTLICILAIYLTIITLSVSHVLGLMVHVKEPIVTEEYEERLTPVFLVHIASILVFSQACELQ